jgi:mono/diheme cytochrome c family protein
MMTNKLGLALVAFSLTLVACSKEKTIVQFMPHMANTPALKSQKGYEGFADGASVRMPPDGTLPRGMQRYHFDDPEVAAKELSNPLAINEINLRRGEKIFNTYCYVCHGYQGHGDGPVVPPYPIPKSLHSEAMRTWKDGHLFHVITKGQGIMPAYAQQILPQDRWAAILYVRALQRAENPTDADVAAYKKVKVQ